MCFCCLHRIGFASNSSLAAALNFGENEWLGDFSILLETAYMYSFFSAQTVDVIN